MKERVGVILTRGGKVLLIRRHNRGQEYFVLPGGHVEAGETLEEAAVRELREECGVTVELGQKVLAFDNQDYEAERQRYVAFLATSYSGEVGRNIGGPEGERPGAEEAYHFAWVVPAEAARLNVKPHRLKQLLVERGERWI